MTLAQDLVGKCSNASLALTKLAPPLQKNEWSKYLEGIVDAPQPVGYREYFERLRARTAAGPTFRRVLLATSLAPAICGMGERTPGENGLTLHPVYGVPYLPGTSLKGILRAWVLSQNWGPEWQEGGLHFRVLFGEGGDRGETAVVDILDALPVPEGQFKKQVFTIDVLTPHFSDYYRGKSNDAAPLGWEGPIPVQFLAASKGLQYRVLLEGDHAWVDKAATWLSLALGERGVGAKSRAGYGRFDCKALGAEHPDELSAAKRSEDARRTKAERLAEEYSKVLRARGKDAVRGEVEKWLLGEAVSAAYKSSLPSPRESAPRDRLSAIQALGKEWAFRVDWDTRIRSKQADDKKKARAHQLIGAWDALFATEAT